MLAQFEDHQWKHRLILIFADENGPTYLQQMDNLCADSTGLKDRDIRIYSIFPHSSQPELSPSDRALIRRKYNPKQIPFLVLLIGKDGGVKARRTDLYPRREIFDLIGSMPMRQAEMRRKKKGDG